MSEFRVGMCSKCNDRVWLTPSGACSRGHGSAPISGVEEHDTPATPLPKTVFCRGCGSELFETVAVCGNCGTPQPIAGSGGAGVGAGAAESGAPSGGVGAGYQPGGDFNSQQWDVGGSRIGVSASVLPPLAAAPEFSALDPYYQDEFRRIYESKEMYKGRWNWAAFFFGPIWMLARDMPLTGLISLALLLVIGSITAGTGMPAVGIAYHVYLGVRGNYLRYVALYKRVQTFVE